MRRIDTVEKGAAGISITFWFSDGRALGMESRRRRSDAGKILFQRDHHPLNRRRGGMTLRR